MQKKKYVLPAMEHKFKIQVEGEESKQMWLGDFLFRRPTLRERSMIDTLHKRLNADLTTIDPDVAALNEALAFLRFTLKDYPQWWKQSDMGGDLYDANVILEIYNKCLMFEADWRRKVMGGKPEDVEDADEKVKPELSAET